MFIVGWEGPSPQDKMEWVEVLREVFGAAAGSYSIRFRPGPRGWTFDLECREDLGPVGPEMIANSRETIRFNIVQALGERGKPMDPRWREET